MNKIRRVLIVTDTAAASKKLRAVFDTLPPQWNAYFSESLEDAVSYLNQVSFDVVFAELEAGPIACTHFLQELWVRDPELIRFVITDGMSKELMIACAMGAHQVIEKPISIDAVRAALQRVDLVNALVRDKKVRSLVARIRVFPPRPKIYAAVMQELSSPNASAITVGELVSRDLGISAKLLQVVNSAAFGLVQQVSTPVDAVFLLGLDTTASLVLGIEAFSQLDNLPAMGPVAEQTWRHSQQVARAAKQIAEWMTGDPATAHAAFTAGLLHDIGKVALAANLGDEYQAIAKLARTDNRKLSDVEDERLGANHAEAGGYLLGLWGLPNAVIEAVAAHHLPAQQLRSRFSALTAVHLANTLEYAKHSMASGFGEFKMNLDYPPELRIQEQFETLAELLSFPELANTTQFVRRTESRSAGDTYIPQPDPLAFTIKQWWARLAHSVPGSRA